MDKPTKDFQLVIKLPGDKAQEIIANAAKARKSAQRATAQQRIQRGGQAGPVIDEKLQDEQYVIASIFNALIEDHARMVMNDAARKAQEEAANLINEDLKDFKPM